MSEKPSNAGARWTPRQDRELKHLAQQNTPTRVMGLKLDRTEGAVRSRAKDLGMSLKPTNQSPYGTKRR